MLIRKANGEDIVALFAAFQNSPLMLLVLNNQKIESIKDFKNKKIMITPDAKGTASLIAMLNSHKISLSDIIIQKHSYNLDDLINGKTDAMASYLSNEPIRLKNKKYLIEFFILKIMDSTFIVIYFLLLQNLSKKTLN